MLGRLGTFLCNWDQLHLPEYPRRVSSGRGRKLGGELPLYGGQRGVRARVIGGAAVSCDLPRAWISVFLYGRAGTRGLLCSPPRREAGPTLPGQSCLPRGPRPAGKLPATGPRFRAESGATLPAPQLTMPAAEFGVTDAAPLAAHSEPRPRGCQLLSAGGSLCGCHGNHPWLLHLCLWLALSPPLFVCMPVGHRTLQSWGEL